MILTFVFVERNAVIIAVKLKWTKDVIMSWCIGQKLGTCTVLRRRHPMWRNGGTVFLTFEFFNLENEQPVKIETV